MRRFGVIALTVVVAASALLVLGGRNGHAASAAPGSASLGERLELGVVAIDARIGDERVHSSGAVIDARAGLVVTAAHAVWGATSLRLTTGLGILHGRVVARAPCAGLALVEIQPRLPGLAALPPAARAAVATESLSAVGRREEDLITIPVRSAGSVPLARYAPGLPPLEDALRLDAPIVPEASGGAVVNDAGELVGIAMATAAGDALALPWATIQTRLDELEIDERRIYVGWREQYRCAPALHAHAQREHTGYRARDARINAPVPATRLPGTERLDER